MQRKNITIREDQEEWLQRSNLNFSSWIQDELDALIESSTPGDAFEPSDGDLVELTGRIVDFHETSGLVLICDECQQLVRNGHCPDGCQRPTGGPASDRLQVNATLDTGDETVQFHLNEDVVRNLTGMTLDGAMEQAREKMSTKVVEDELESELFDKHVSLVGSYSEDVIGIDDVEQAGTLGGVPSTPTEPILRVEQARFVTPEDENAVEVSTTLYACEDCNSVLVSPDQARDRRCKHRNTREIGSVSR